jgi:hypothetical protein
MENGPFIDGLPSLPNLKMVIWHSNVNIYQRVNPIRSPLNHHKITNFPEAKPYSIHPKKMVKLTPPWCVTRAVRWKLGGRSGAAQRRQRCGRQSGGHEEVAAVIWE